MLKACLVSLLLIASTAFAQEQVFFPMKEKGFFGGEKTLKMEATVYKPEGPGPFPVVMYFHGSTAPHIPQNMTIRPAALAELLVKNGFVVVVPMRKGRGQSEGWYQDQYNCNARPSSSNMEEIAASVRWAKSLPFVDKDKVVLSGISRGGMLAVMYAAKANDPSVKAVVNFVGGWMSERCMINEGLFSEYRSPIKSLWIYGNADDHWSMDAIKRYSAASGNNDLKIYPSGHDVVRHWYLYSTVLLDYLKEMGL